MTADGSINRVLARNLAYWMSEAKLTQSALAEKAGVSQKTISNYLNPDQRVEGSKGKEPSAKLTELDKIANALAIGVWQLLRDQTDSERRMYRAIEEHYANLRNEVVTAATEDAENRRILENAKVNTPAKVARKKSA
jgi:transcriptional regulator with XRE-family HTH domain